ncbi:MAG TPA: CARDB domain-containing protein [Jatrophihabitans sp.]|jgi:hypothetical protein|uniref:CARDB domain-containing protein n=1 Tax=Jatrophihabitans sp. TaxID=1932789 RepID=UPI002F0BE2A5
MNRTRALLAVTAALATTFTLLPGASASNPSSGGLTPPAADGSNSVTWTGGPYTGFVNGPEECTDLTCDTYTLNFEAPADYWNSHDGSVTVGIKWGLPSDDFDLYVYDSAGTKIKDSAAPLTTSESVDLGQLPPGAYTVKVVPYQTAGGSYSGTATVSAFDIPTAMKFPEDRSAVEKQLVQDYPLNIVFVGRTPSAAEVADLKSRIPTHYRPPVSNKSANACELSQVGAGLLNWNKCKSASDDAPYFLGVTYRYQVNVLVASEAYTKSLFQVAKNNTAQAQDYRSGKARGQNQAKYDAAFGNYRMLAKGGDVAYKVTAPTKTDLIDGYAIEDWIFNSRLDATNSCAFKNAETGACVAASVVNPDPSAYHDPFYDKNGLNLDRMPQGLNNGSSYFFLDTFTPSYAKNYFRPNAYHTYGTDRVINGTIIPKPIEQGGSWRITDPDTKAWDGVDFARTWGGRYRFHFVDLGAAPNDYEDASWANYGVGMSSDYPHGDPPVWQYTADPLWTQSGESCLTAGPGVPGVGDLPWRNDTPCRMMPRLARDVAYGLFFRSTSGYLYRPIPRGDVNWLAVSNWTDFYSRPQWVNGQLTNGGGVYGTWWTNSDLLYKIDSVNATTHDDTLRWLSSATPYARWVGRKDEVIPLYDPTNNQPTGQHLNVAPKYEDLPAPSHHVKVTATGTDLVPEPLYNGEHVHTHYGVNLTEVSNTLEKAKATGADATHDVTGTGTYDDAVNGSVVRDYIDSHPHGIADHVEGINTIPSINMTWEKAYTWSLPAIVGGIAFYTEDGEAWGVLNNVNDRIKAKLSHYPAVQPGDAPGSKRSLTDQALPTQDPGGGMSYTVEHEAAHNLGLSHPHDGSYGVDKCPAGDPKAGQWECYWSGLGWMYDISAAPTTYAMSYRPYEVEDQDNLQRGHVAEYLIGAQAALTDRLSKEAKAGGSTPSAAWAADYDRMKQWRSQAGELFRKGDYLHAEYAARNASLAARGFPQTPANTSDPKLVEAGQVFYFNVHPQGTGEKPNLTPTSLSAAQPTPKQTVLTAAVSNPSGVPATEVVVQFLDGTTPVGTSAPVNVGPGATVDVSVRWNTTAVKGDRSITAVVDPANAIAESNESDNRLTRTITVKGNKVTNGSFESGTAQPTSWTSTGTLYDTSGAHASDGTDAVGLSSKVASVTSAAIPVQAGQTYQFAATLVSGTVPSVSVEYLDAGGNLLRSVEPVLSGLTGSFAAASGATQLKITLAAPTTLGAGQVIWLDDVWVW